MNEDINDDEAAAHSLVENALLDLLDQDIAAHPERLQPSLPTWYDAHNRWSQACR